MKASLDKQFSIKAKYDAINILKAKIKLSF